MGFIDYKKDNTAYAPGLSTYSAPGEKGDDGKRGASLHYTPSSIKDNAYEREVANIKIRNGNPMYTEVEVSYAAGDLVIDGSSYVFLIIDGEDGLTLSENPIGRLSNTVQTIFNTDNYSYDLITKGSDHDVIQYGITDYGTISSAQVGSFVQIRDNSTGHCQIVGKEVISNQ